MGGLEEAAAIDHFLVACRLRFKRTSLGRAFGTRLSLVLLAFLLLVPLPQAAPSRAAPVLQSLVYGSTGEPDTLNPLLTQTAAGQAVDSAVFDSLLRVDGRDQLQPGLATSWQRTRDGRTWTFHLRHGVKFADGVDFTSTDVYWTYLTVINPNNKVATAQGWDEVDSMRTPDRFTLVMHLRQWLAPWLLEVGTTAILPKHTLYKLPTIDSTPFNRTPFGTGPYRVIAWQPGSSITLAANPYSWQGKPHLRTITYRIFPDDAHLLSALRAGSVALGPVNAQQAHIAAGFPRAKLVETPSMTWYHVDLKQWGYLREQAVRQALDFATPKAAIVHDILQGHGQVALADIAPAMTGYYNPAVPVHGYDPLRAAEILAADGFRPGAGGVLQRCTAGRNCVPLRIALWSIGGDYFGQQVNARLAREWRAIGVGVDLRTALLSQIFGPTGPQFSHEMTGVTYGWTNGDDPDDRFYWNSAYVPASPSAAGGNDIAYFFRFAFQSEIDTLTNTGVLQTDPAKRREVYNRIQSLLADQTPVIFLYWQDSIMLIPRGLQGFQPSPFTPLFWNVVQWR